MKLFLDILGWASVGVIALVIVCAAGLFLKDLVGREPYYAAAWLGVGAIVGLANRVLFKYTDLWGHNKSNTR